MKIETSARRRSAFVSRGTSAPAAVTLGALLVIAAATLVACGGGGSAQKGGSSPSVTARTAVPLGPTAGATGSAPSPTARPQETPPVQPSPTTPATPPTLVSPSATSTSAPPPPPPPPHGQTVTVLAEGGKFKPAGLAAAANVPLTIMLSNVDPNVAHDIRFSLDGVFVAGSDLVVGPGDASITFTPSAGTYKISCSVHTRTMGGTLTVQ